ncbi:hypothetical protein A3C09_03895 [Candidatus Uhrbacteria bacterium RIFCSPHIGHO2_02_FULL_47_44]|uniref:SsuA/THI5-like domain-containing protein n=1 Tax=Candidatus Uhrbacteria bacterium RIFCSPLOWO2_02_FULL_48_18 TaxID=1802408 RepID=A0A1F7VCE5_9BACT|nr:MAG: hypothetical protein A2839_01900 [Candidatus Uhrbacteria bacterium RIFCSPHIGHO2_01_FULL_47_10]OGL71821.1 MAG: hypothetical protein A3C09_03895 [Candidatus Uhrbacteria bacterium RIFCSPHIGHO2_02_FULL_47_44]OGL77046.1 MAG: hypothetical protein A3E97_01440 [Candidatus Uhrbacteria bacterium RIFCSPHIGHO2_12_FULL_47_12]OGL80605.1 MAG: hypothetical protein A3B20_04390 [Candidatus Uhrbacteria bacterium RIFCSPLOWO2_01_FULL_47_17]OGL88212.1 MAG: hypothetical protein A3I41_00590 [Candidatus Uhrbact
MLKRNIQYIMALASALAITACGKSEAPQTPVKDEPVVAEKAPVAETPPAAAANPAPTAVANPAPEAAPANLPKFTLAWSEYTTWSLLVTAKDVGLIDAAEGKHGELERKYGVDIVLVKADYGKTMEQYQGGIVDSVVITNTDALSVAQARFDTVKDSSVAAFATSVSEGADKIQTNPDIKNWAQLKGVPVFGDEMSVTRYLHWRGCAINKTDVKDYPFQNLNPVDGSNQFAANSNPEMRAFGGWSPETLKVAAARPDVNDLFNSSKLGKYEITDMFVVGQSALDRAGGKEAVKALAEAYTTMVNRAENTTTQAATLAAVSKNFSDTPADTIKLALTLTLAIKPDQAQAVFGSEDFKKTIPLTTEFAKSVTKTISGPVVTAFGTKAEAPSAVLRFDASYVTNPTVGANP